MKTSIKRVRLSNFILCATAFLFLSGADGNCLFSDDIADFSALIEVDSEFVIDSSQTGPQKVIISLNEKIPAEADGLQVKKAVLSNFSYSGNCNGIQSSDITIDQSLIEISIAKENATPFFEMALPVDLKPLVNDPVVDSLIAILPCTNLSSGGSSFEISQEQLETVNRALTDWTNFAKTIRTTPLEIRMKAGAGVPSGDWSVSGRVKASLLITFGP